MPLPRAGCLSRETPDPGPTLPLSVFKGQVVVLSGCCVYSCRETLPSYRSASLKSCFGTCGLPSFRSLSF